MATISSNKFSVDTFRNSLGNGGARPNQFLVSFGVMGDPTMSMLVQAASLPASSIGEVAVPYRGRQVYVAGERVYEPWTVTILNDTNFTARAKLEAWQNVIARYETVYGETHPKQYMTNLTVEQLDRNENILMTYVMKDAFPINISEVPLAYGDNDTISSFTCTFRYQSFAVSNESGSTSTALGSAPSINKRDSDAK